MADEQHGWLDRETAERLLRGESPDTADATTRDQAERLAAALNALSPTSVPADVELPGEAAALAAFREMRAEQADPGSAVAGAGDAEVVRIGGRPSGAGRARWGRPVRFAVCAALAVGAVGGVAAATTGVLPTPFGFGEPGPAASVEAPTRTPGSPSSGGGSGPAAPGDPSGGAGRDDATAGDGSAPSPGPGSGADDAHGVPGGPQRMASACRDLRDGASLAPGRRRALERAAGGSAHVEAYCRGVLRPGDPGSSGKGDKGDKGQGKGTGPGEGSTGQGRNTGNGNGNGNGNSDGQGSSTGAGKGNSHGQGGGDGGGNAAKGQGGQKDKNGQGGDDDGNDRGGHRLGMGAGAAPSPASAAAGRTPSGARPSSTALAPSPRPTCPTV
ncbi:hypothetical protein ABZ920_09305 [Streptomyces sp. NPDC046831]|uniref:hypothetical protein n=1 Tax=Streptomyces sp. NPDC046831 TaxID=3154805 RepID=UPI003406C22A